MGRKALQLVSTTTGVVPVERVVQAVKLISISPSGISFGNAHVMNFFGFDIGFGLSLCLELGSLQPLDYGQSEFDQGQDE